MPKSCLVLFSGGLDSILACKVLQDQGVRVTALKFITPFFSYDLRHKERADAYREQVREKYGIHLEIVDITDEYLKMVTAPEHGYGRYLNPCIDCKILMVKKAMSLMDKYGASFIATGEVLGQRPMSQRRDTLRIIERDSGAEGILLRPLSACHLKETRPEKEGIVHRQALADITGRSRKEQMRLAKKYGIKDYPAPAGGCVLADPILSERFKKIFQKWPDFTPLDCVVAQVGRHFLLPGGSWLVVGRNKSENERLARLKGDADMVLRAMDRPGPYCLLRKAGDAEDKRLAAAICARYAKAGQMPVPVRLGAERGPGAEVYEVDSLPSQDTLAAMMF
ncbi:MAG: phosphoadenosine phosphosulfate reductase family protein [Thermodesulfobacteria bacterium]|nr:phosphoadenosine phosphosulfate reductase family protein [Thermodesulfobacteriota bacterium]